MTMRETLALLFAACTLLGAADRYVPAGFIEWPAQARIGALSSVAVSRGHIYVLHRGEPPLLDFDSHGKYLKGWGDGLFKVAHGLRIDPAGNLWTTDNGNHVVRKFSPEGKLLLTLGEVDAGGAGPDRFRSPDDIVIDSKGDLYIADSGNGRIVHLNSSGRFVSEWGRNNSPNPKDNLGLALIR